MSRFFLSVQEVKAAILEDMLRLGKDGGLKSFEQVKHWLMYIYEENILFETLTHNFA